jgi:hypothetical protein
MVSIQKRAWASLRNWRWFGASSRASFQRRQSRWSFYAREGGLPGFADAADENVEPFCRRTLTVGDSTTEAVEIDVAGGGALRGADRGGFTGAAKIADRFIIVALSRARKLERFVLQLKNRWRHCSWRAPGRSGS